MRPLSVRDWEALLVQSECEVLIYGSLVPQGVQPEVDNVAGSSERKSLERGAVDVQYPAHLMKCQQYTPI